MGSIMFCASCQEHHAPCDERVKQLTAATQRADAAEQQRDALAAQNAELVAALREFLHRDRDGVPVLTGDCYCPWLPLDENNARKVVEPKKHSRQCLAARTVLARTPTDAAERLAALERVAEAARERGVYQLDDVLAALDRLDAAGKP